MKSELQKIGVIVVCIIILFSLYGMKTAYSNIHHAVEVFDLTQVWKTWNTILVVIQVLGIVITIHFAVKLTNGKEFVLVRKDQPEDEIVEVWEDYEDGWAGKRKVSKSELPSEAEVMTQLRIWEGTKTYEFWARQLKRTEVKEYKEARMFCLTEQGKAKKRTEAQESPSPTLNFALK